MPPDTDKRMLLEQLRIDRNQREDVIDPRQRRWFAGGLLVLITLAAGVWFVLSRPSGLPVRTAVAQPISSGGANASVLDATGYVTARREATVSAQITGTLTEVLIEEGDQVWDVSTTPHSGRRWRKRRRNCIRHRRCSCSMKRSLRRANAM